MSLVMPSRGAHINSSWSPSASAKNLADRILQRGDRIGCPGALVAARRCGGVRGDLAALLLRRLVRDHHGPVGLPAGLLVARDGDPDAVGLGLQKVGIVAR